MNAPDWRTRAACRDEDPEWWFPTKDRDTTELALDVCRDCPVRQQCLQHAIDHDERWGIFGGYTRDQRATLTRPRAPRQPRPAPQHGTDAGFYAHRRGTRPDWPTAPCGDCKAAHLAAERARDARLRATRGAA